MDVDKRDLLICVQKLERPSCYLGCGFVVKSGKEGLELLGSLVPILRCQHLVGYEREPHEHLRSAEHGHRA